MFQSWTAWIEQSADVVVSFARASVWSGSTSLASGPDRFFDFRRCSGNEWTVVRVADLWPVQLVIPRPKCDARERVALCLKTAIPLPKSGSFNDLLGALDEAEKDEIRRP